jgi:hypothetical protein
MAQILPEIHVGDLPFDDIVDKGLLYADKTGYILELIKAQDYQFFLSRPRRFGESLLLSAMKSVFLGQKELFSGLAIAAQGYDFHYSNVGQRGAPRFGQSLSRRST